MHSFIKFKKCKLWPRHNCKSEINTKVTALYVQLKDWALWVVKIGNKPDKKDNRNKDYSIEIK